MVTGSGSASGGGGKSFGFSSSGPYNTSNSNAHAASLIQSGAVIDTPLTKTIAVLHFAEAPIPTAAASPAPRRTGSGRQNSQRRQHSGSGRGVVSLEASVLSPSSGGSSGGTSGTSGTVTSPIPVVAASPVPAPAPHFRLNVVDSNGAGRCYGIPDTAVVTLRDLMAIYVRSHASIWNLSASSALVGGELLVRFGARRLPLDDSIERLGLPDLATLGMCVCLRRPILHR